MYSTSMLVVAKPRQRHKTMPTYTQKQKDAFKQGKKDGSKHGKVSEEHLKTYKNEKESYNKGLKKGLKQFNSNKQQNRKQVCKYQAIFDRICMQNGELANAKVKKVDTMLTHLEDVVKSSHFFKKQETIMETMMSKAGQDYAKRKECADNVMALVKNYRIKGSEDESDAAAFAMKALNESVAESTKTIHSIRRNIYQKYIDDVQALKTILTDMQYTIDEKEIPRIVNAMEIQRNAIDKEDSKADGKMYRREQQQKSRANSEAGDDMSDKFSEGSNSQPGTPQTRKLGQRN